MTASTRARKFIAAATTVGQQIVGSAKALNFVLLLPVKEVGIRGPDIVRGSEIS